MERQFLNERGSSRTSMRWRLNAARTDWILLRNERNWPSQAMYKSQEMCARKLKKRSDYEKSGSRKKFEPGEEDPPFPYLSPCLHMGSLWLMCPLNTCVTEIIVLNFGFFVSYVLFGRNGPLCVATGRVCKGPRSQPVPLRTESEQELRRNNEIQNIRFAVKASSPLPRRPPTAFCFATRGMRNENRSVFIYVFLSAYKTWFDAANEGKRYPFTAWQTEILLREPRRN